MLKTVSCAHLAATFKFDLMGAVVALIVGLAGGLALVVLFTLANTNVSERIREMATLKVLGFYDREVHNYVNREMMILTGMGVVVGLPLGRWIGGLLTAALNMPSLYFEVEVHWYSYAIAVVATLAFALLVQLFTNSARSRRPGQLAQVRGIEVEVQFGVDELNFLAEYLQYHRMYS